MSSSKKTTTRKAAKKAIGGAPALYVCPRGPHITRHRICPRHGVKCKEYRP